jgi:hypothetical protein
LLSLGFVCSDDATTFVCRRQGWENGAIRPEELHYSKDEVIAQGQAPRLKRLAHQISLPER